MDKITFSSNWNNKLCCEYFTSIRLYNDLRYGVGRTLEVAFKDKIIKKVQVISMKRLMLKDITTYIAGLDTGYPPEQCRKIISQMYPNVNFNTEPLSFILFKTLK